MKSVELNYLVHDLELATVILALNLWRHYLCGTKCALYTDYKTLHHIKNQKELNMRQSRWVKLLSYYDCKISYHPRKANVVVDALSYKDPRVSYHLKSTGMVLVSGIFKKIRLLRLRV